MGSPGGRNSLSRATLANSPTDSAMEQKTGISLRSSRPRRPGCFSRRTSRHPIRLDQVKYIRLDLGWVGIPFVSPMSIDFPVGAGQFATVIRAPLANCLMCLVETVEGTEVRRRGYSAGRGERADNFAVPGERSFQFDANFQVDLTVPVDRDVSTCTRDLLRADVTPNQTASVWYDLGEFLRTRPAAHDGKGVTAKLFEPDVVFHANHLYWLALRTNFAYKAVYSPSSRGNRGNSGRFRPRSCGNTQRITCLFRFSVPLLLTGHRRPSWPRLDGPPALR
jgi:hypothetical protein